jgi:hypothetical protein
MPFVTILNAAVILSGGKPSPGDGDLNDVAPGSLADKILVELSLGARLGKLASTKPVGERSPYWFETVDLDDARAFIQERGIQMSGVPPVETRRNQQMRLLKHKADELGINLKVPKKGQLARLRDALRADNLALFSNWRDIWKAAISKGIAKPVK